MGYVNTTISLVSTELAFLQAFIAALCAADSRIVCTTNDLAAQFEDSTAFPTFNINFGGADTISFRRKYASSSTASSYDIISSRWAGTLKTDFEFSSDNYAKNAQVRRTWGFRVISGTDMIFADFYKYNNAAAPFFQLGFMTGASKSSTWGVDGTERKLIKENFKLDGGTLVHKLDRIPYVYNAANSAQIEKINGKIFNTIGTDAPVVTIGTLIDCSTVPYGSWWTINSKRYYALDEHTLMEV